jgi:uncharacterized damage-inducible protein DinB
MTRFNPIDNGADISSDASQLIHGCMYCVDQCDQLLRMISQSIYVNSTENSSSVGAHIRHILDRYQSFFNGIPEGVINYDARKQDKSIESNLEAANFALSSLSRRIEALDLAENLGRGVTVCESVHHERPSVSIPSTVDRELMELVNHSTHHLAIIALLVKPFGFIVGSDFGKAPSTIVHERS